MSAITTTEALAELRQLRDDYKRSHDALQFAIEWIEHKTAPGNDPAVLATSVNELKVRARVRHLLRTLECQTIGDVLQHRTYEFLCNPNFGRISYNELKAALRLQFGVTLEG